MTTRKQLEQEAAELYPRDDCGCHPCFWRRRANDRQARRAFIAGRTVTAEQVEAAMQGYHEGWDAEYNGRRLHQSAIKSAFRAAGFYVEGEE